jgi:carbamoyltransferase
MDLTVGLGGGARNASVALCSPTATLGICEQERITRVRGAGFNATGYPDEALDELLWRTGHDRHEVVKYAVTSDDAAPAVPSRLRLEPHFALACSAYLSSPFESAAILVCDTETPEISVWRGEGSAISRVHWPWQGGGFARLYSQAAETFGFAGFGREQRMEALARVDPARREHRASELVALETDRLQTASGWQRRVEGWIAGCDWSERAALAGAVQGRIGELLLEFAAQVGRQLPTERRLCVAGSVFTNSYFNSLLKCSGLFDAVFVPVNPGAAGISLGAALYASGPVRRTANPFSGPAYSAEEIKSTLDNCKLTYQWASEADRIRIAIDALKGGRLVAWYDGAMEWGPRALGARSILASPFAPYVLENLNHFLKRRDMWRGYALSALEFAVPEHFDGPDASPFMECDYVPTDRMRFQSIQPAMTAADRIQTLGAGAPQAFHALLRAFGEECGIPILVNTSFNGFREPIVCSPNDAVRVFFGSGLDLLVIGEFVIRK